MKETYSYTTAAQKEANGHDRLMIAAQMMAALIPHCDTHRKQAAKETAKKALEFTDELFNAVK